MDGMNLENSPKPEGGLLPSAEKIEPVVMPKANVVERIELIVTDLFDKGLSGDFIAAKIGMPRENEAATRFSKGEISREMFQIECLSYIRNNILPLFNEGTAESLAQVVGIHNKCLGLKAHFESDPKYYTERIQAHNAFEEREGGKGIYTNPSMGYFDNGRYTGRIELFSSGSGTRPVVQGEILYELDGKKITNCTNISSRNGLVQGLIAFDSSRVYQPVVDGKIVTEIDGVPIYGGSYYKATATSFDGLVELKPRHAHGYKQGGDIPVVDGKLITEIEGAKIIHCFEMSVVEGKLKGVFMLEGKEGLKYQVRRVEGGKVMVNAPTILEPLTEIKPLLGSGNYSRYQELMAMKPADRVHHIEERMSPYKPGAQWYENFGIYLGRKLYTPDDTEFIDAAEILSLKGVPEAKDLLERIFGETRTSYKGYYALHALFPENYVFTKSPVAQNEVGNVVGTLLGQRPQGLGSTLPWILDGGDTCEYKIELVGQIGDGLRADLKGKLSQFPPSQLI